MYAAFDECGPAARRPGLHRLNSEPAGQGLIQSRRSCRATSRPEAARYPRSTSHCCRVRARPRQDQPVRRFIRHTSSPTRRSRNPLIESIWNSPVQPVIHRSAQRLRHVHDPPVGNVEVPRAAASGAKARSPSLIPGAQPRCPCRLNARPANAPTISRHRKRHATMHALHCRHRDGMASRRRPVMAAGPSRRSLPLAVPPACRPSARARARNRDRNRGSRLED